MIYHHPVNDDSAPHLDAGSKRPIRVRARNGQTRYRAGIKWSPEWASVELTHEQIAELRADTLIEVDDGSPSSASTQKPANVADIDMSPSTLYPKPLAAHASADLSESELEALTAPKLGQKRR